MDENVSAVVLLIGLAVGVDYSLFYVKREREERAAGRSERAALEAAAATSGRAVLVSGLTVMIAMAGMFLTGDPTFSSFAIATIMVVAIAVLGSLTVLPALLARLGDNVDRRPGAVPAPRCGGHGGGRFWNWRSTACCGDRSLSAACLGGGPRRARTACAPDEHRRAGRRGASRRTSRRCRSTTGSRTRSPASRRPPSRSSRRRRSTPRTSQAAIGELTRAGSGERRRPRAGHSRRQRRADRRPNRASDRGSRHRRRRRTRRSRRFGTRSFPATVGGLPGVEAGITGETAFAKDFDDALRGDGAARLRLRARVRVPAAARLVPVGRDRGQGDRAQPALRRGRVRRARARLPARLGEGAPRLRLHGRGDGVAAGVPVRDPVRALDGLPRLHPEPDPRGLRRRHEDGGCDRPRDQVDGRAS